jgi:hypothetical protein
VRNAWLQRREYQVHGGNVPETTLPEEDRGPKPPEEDRGPKPPVDDSGPKPPVDDSGPKPPVDDSGRVVP